MTLVLLSLVLPLLGSAARAAPSAQNLLQTAGTHGGLVVHLGCGDGHLTAALHAGDAYLVHGLDTDPKDVQAARDYVRGQGLHGRVTVEAFDGQHLPFVSDLVNLLVTDDLGKVPQAEVLRVLAPRGVALIGGTKLVKPWPPSIHEWTHYLGEADNNAVSDDQLAGGPRALQWWASPIWLRYHDRLASVSTVVSSNGRLFYIVDRGSIIASTFEPQWFLEARDAFNGVLLWRQPMKSWVSHLRKFRSGPVQIARLLVARGDRVYAAMGIGEPVSVLDARSGRTLAELAGTANAEEIILHGGVLLVVLGAEAPEHAFLPNTDYRKKTLVAVDAASGRALWHWPTTGTANIVPQSLAADGERVLLQDGTDTLCLNLESGSQNWRTPTFAPPKPSRPAPGRKRKAVARSPGWDYATLVIHDDVALSCNGKMLCALTVEAGKKLWECSAKTPFGRVPSVDVLVLDDVVWISPSLTQGRDLHTGEVVKTLDLRETLTTAGHHHRCYRDKGVGDFLVFGHRGMDFLDTKGDRHSRNNWVRGLCQYGVMPANGLLYAPPNNCGCYPEALIHAFVALGDERRLLPIPAGFTGRLERGVASDLADGPGAASATDWPQYRGSSARRGVAPAALPTGLKPMWEASVGGELTPPVIAGGRVVVARKDDNTVYALDERTGSSVWHFAAGGMVDSPPTVYAGRVLFGSHDGTVYCLRLTDGQLAWRFHAAPASRNTVVLGRVESLWPVPGSVLVKNGVAYFAAGRSTYLDGGMFLFGLDAATGEVRHHARLQGAFPGPIENTANVETVSLSQNKIDYKTFAAPDKSDAFSMEGNTGDIMVADSDSVYLRHMRFNDELARQATPKHHLFSTASLLDDTESHRSHWFYGNGDFRGLNVAYEWITRGSYGGFSAPFGTLLVFDAATAWGVNGQGEKGVVFASPLADIDQRLKKDFPAPRGQKFPDRRWQQPLTMHPRALLKAGASLYLGGAVDTEHLLNGEGGVVQVVAAADGASAGKFPLAAPPVFDGMAVAGGKLFVSLSNGKVVCLGARELGSVPRE